MDLVGNFRGRDCETDIRVTQYDEMKMCDTMRQYHFTVVRLIGWSLNENETGVDLVLIKASLLFLSKFVLIRIKTASIA